MNNLFNLQPQQIKTLYNSLALSKSKEKIDMVLEPLQAMIQISLLSVSPIGTKMTIQENILYLQNPSIIQPFSRWYNSDKKDDLYFLFQVIKRFMKWYNPNYNNKSRISSELYALIVKLSLKGFNNLLITYSSTDNNAITQVIHMYKNLLGSIDATEIDKTFNEKTVNIDEVFENINEIYNENLLNIIHNTLLIVDREDDDSNYYNYINGLNLLMEKSNKQIQSWIKNNLSL